MKPPGVQWNNQNFKTNFNTAADKSVRPTHLARFGRTAFKVGLVTGGHVFSYPEFILCIYADRSLN